MSADTAIGDFPSLAPHGAEGWQVSRRDYGVSLRPAVTTEGGAPMPGTDFQVFRFRAIGDEPNTTWVEVRSFRGARLRPTAQNLPLSSDRKPISTSSGRLHP